LINKHGKRKLRLRSHLSSSRRTKKTPCRLLFLVLVVALFSLYLAGCSLNKSCDLTPEANSADFAGQGEGILEGSAGNEQEELTEVAPRPGARAPAFSLQDLEGKELSLDDLSGQPVIINFWTTWCSFCAEEMPLLESLHTSGEVVVLAVNVQDDTEQVERFIQESGYTFPVLLDTKGEVFQTYRLSGFPTTLALDEQGMVRSIRIGAFDEKGLEQLVQSAEGETVQ